MREFLPSATAPLPLREPSGVTVTLATVLPGAAAALVRPDGSILLGMQVQTRSGDLSADLARALRWAQEAEPGTALPVVGPGVGGDLVRLQDVLDPAATLEPDAARGLRLVDPAGRGRLGARAGGRRLPGARQRRDPADGAGVGRRAYGPRTGWTPGRRRTCAGCGPEPEEALLAALARLQARGELGLSDDARYAGSFRAHGLLVPVWDLDRELHAKEWSEPVAAFAARLDAALAETAPLTDAERRARDALAGKQVTLR